MCKASKKTKKIVAAILSVLLVLVMIIMPTVMPTYAYSAKAKSYIKYDDGTIIGSGEISYAKKYYDEHKEVCDKVLEGVINMEAEVDISEFNIKDTASKVVNAVIRSHPEIFYKKTHKSIGSKDKILKVSFEYYYTKEEVVEKRKELNAEIEKIVSRIDENMSPVEKALAIHDEIVGRCKYETDKENVYATLVEGKSSCMGYSLAFSYFMSIFGIDTEVVSSESMNHAWNKICLDGKYYNVDLAWDDPVPERVGYIDHSFFLASDESFTNEGGHGGYKENSYYPADDKKYDNVFIHDIDTRMCYIKSYYYMIYNKMDGKYANEYYQRLLRYNINTEEVTIVRRFDYKWMVGNIGYWGGNFMGLGICGNMLYYNSPSEIFMYDPVKDITYSVPYDKPDGVEGDIYGMDIIEGELYAAFGVDPNDYMEAFPLMKCDENPYKAGTVQTIIDGNVHKLTVCFGDVDRDGEVNIMDATHLQKYLSELTDLDDIQKLIADVNNDTDINIIDCTDIQKYIVNL